MEFIVIISLLVIGFIFSFFHKSINLSMWQNKLEIKIGPLQDEIYIPYNVLHGHEGPLVSYLTIVFLIGFFSIPFTLNNDFILLTIFLFMCPVSIFFPILVFNVFRSDREPEGREKLIEVLNQKIEKDGDDISLLNLFQRYSRSMYRLDLIEIKDFESENSLDTIIDELNNIRKDLDLCISNNNSEKWLRKQAKQVKKTIPGLINKFEKFKKD